MYIQYKFQIKFYYKPSKSIHIGLYHPKQAPNKILEHSYLFRPGVEPVDPVIRRGTGNQVQKLSHVGGLLVQKSVHKLHTVLLTLIPAKIGQG